MASRPFVHDEHRDEVLSPTAEETSRIRYTAATCDPDDFTRSGYSLRHYGRDTELFIAVTMCDEDVVLFSRTMDSCVVKPCRRARTSTEPEPQNCEKRCSPL